MYAHRARQLGAKDRDVDVFVIEALFNSYKREFRPGSTARVLGRGR